MGDEGTRLGWGVLGCGTFARRRILPAFRASSNAQVVALQRRTLADAQAAAREAGVPRAYATREELLRDPEVQAVYVSTHNAGHLEDVLAAAAAGKHVLCEKPLGVNAEECRQMTGACARAGRALFVGHSNRYRDAVAQARALVASGALGRLQGARIWYGFRCAPGVWRRDSRLSGGGPLLDLGPHVLDFLRFATGEEVEAVAARVDPDVDGPTGRCEDRARALLRLRSGVTASLEVSFDEPLRNGFELYGTQAHLRGDYTLCNLEGALVRLEKYSGDPGPIQMELRPLAPRPIYQLQIEDVTRAILDPSHTPLCATARDGVRIAEIVDAIYAAGRSGRWERIEEPERMSGPTFS